ncbi:speedy protein 1-A-like, partial [Anomaloglossus baeobatrachus]
MATPIGHSDTNNITFFLFPFVSQTGKEQIFGSQIVEETGIVLSNLDQIQHRRFCHTAEDTVIYTSATITHQRSRSSTLYTDEGDEDIQLFLAKDICLRISDKYLLAMVLVYFKRAGLSTEEYRENFFPSLFLANQFEEDVDFREEIYAWALGRTWEQRKEELHYQRNQLLLRMDFRAWVDRATCDLIMAQDPSHWVWMRNRRIHHSWAIGYEK